MTNADDQKIALDWIKTIEGETGRIRENDIYPRLKSWINESSSFNILDVGCGQGICSDKIDLTGRHYIGVEPSSDLLERAKQLYQNEHRQFIPGNAYELPFEDGFFDAVYSVSVWHLLDDLQKAAAEVSRVLLTGGSFLVVTANPDAYSIWKKAYTESKMDGQRFEGKIQLQDQSIVTEVLYLTPLRNVLRSLQLANLKVSKTETFRSDRYIWIQGKKA
jgi:SAM-dependent methyltransferase